MTIVAGLPGKGGVTPQGDFDPNRAYVVLAADSEESGYHLKISARKIVTVDKGSSKCLIGGAGGGQFIDFAIQEIDRRLTSPFTLDRVREQIEEIVTEIHEERIGPLNNANNEFELLCAIWIKDAGIQMVKVGNHISLVLPGPTAIGTGDELAKYLIATYHWPVALYHATRLAVFLLSEVKENVMQCGGKSQVVWMDDTGQSQELQPGSIAEHEKSNAAVMDEGARQLLYLADPAGWGYDLAGIDAALNNITDTLKERLKAAYPQLKPPPATGGGLLGDLPGVPE